MTSSAAQRRPTEPQPFKEHALCYAQAGWPVFPLVPSGKRPLTEHGLKDASTDAETICGWWKQWPDANIGLAVPGDYFVVDIDSEEALSGLEAQGFSLPLTATAKTGRGWHQWYETGGAEVKNGVGVFPGVDIRSAGGYAIVPPSVHESGVIYEWVTDLTCNNIAAAPEWLLERLLRTHPPAATHSKVDSGRVLSGVPEGQRDDALFRFACKLRHADLPRAVAERLALESAAQCTPPFPEQEALAKVANAYDRYSNSGSTGSKTQPFGPVQELPPLLPEVPELPPELLPTRLRAWLVDISERMQVPLELAAVPALVSLSAVVGRRVAVHPKAKDDWLVVPNLWGGIVARPGKLKSPTLGEALKPLRRLAVKAHETHREKSDELGSRHESLKAKETAFKDLLKQAHKGKVKENQRSPEELEQELTEVRREIGGLTEDLIERRYYVNDTTIEKLGELFVSNPVGLLLERDELAGWLRSLEREDRKGDREFFLEAWNGTNTYTCDRIGRGTIHMPALCLSVIGGIQPSKFSRFITEAVQGGYAADGLLQRFQMLVWPEVQGEWELIDRQPDTCARDEAFAVFEALDRFKLPHSDDGPIPTLRFERDAQKLFYQWLSNLEKRLRSREMEDTPAFESHLAKYRSLMPSLALLFHLVETLSTDGPVELSAARHAADWCDFLEQHALKVYAAELRMDLTAAHALAKKIRDGAITSGMTVRDIYNCGWAKLKSAESVLDGLKVLAERGWARAETEKSGGGGRPKLLLHVNPALKEVRG